MRTVTASLTCGQTFDRHGCPGMVTRRSSTGQPHAYAVLASGHAFGRGLVRRGSRHVSRISVGGEHDLQIPNVQKYGLAIKEAVAAAMQMIALRRGHSITVAKTRICGFSIRYHAKCPKTQDLFLSPNRRAVFVSLPHPEQIHRFENQGHSVS
jgi:hypothetical protein